MAQENEAVPPYQQEVERHKPQEQYQQQNPGNPLTQTPVPQSMEHGVEPNGEDKVKVTIADPGEAGQ